MTMTKINEHKAKDRKLINIGLIIMALSTSAILSFFIRIVLTFLLKPEPDTTQMAIVNIVSFSSIPVGILIGIILVIIGLVSQKKRI